MKRSLIQSAAALGAFVALGLSGGVALAQSSTSATPGSTMPAQPEAGQAMPGHSSDSTSTEAMPNQVHPAAGEKMPGNSTAPGSMSESDSAITSKVEEKLMSAKNVDASDITVETKDGVVSLSGELRSKSQVRRAKNAAGKVEGVKSVDVSMLTVKGKKVSGK